MNEQPEQLVTLFKNVHGNVNACLRTGETVAFVQGKFFTQNKSLQRALQAAVDNDNEFGIYVDAEEPNIDINAATPLEQLRKKLRQELLDEIASGKIDIKDLGISRQSEAQMQTAVSGTNTLPGAAYESDEVKDLVQGHQVATPPVALVDSTGKLMSEGGPTSSPTAEPTDPEKKLEEPEQKSEGLTALEKLKQGKPIS